MLSVENHRHVEGVDDDEFRHLAEGHVQKVRRVTEIVARFDQIETVAATLVVGDDRGQLGEQANRLGEVGFRRGALGVRVARADDAHRGAHDIHRVRGERQLVDDALDHRAEVPQRPLERFEVGELLLIGQFAVPEQVGDLFEALLGRKLLHRIAPVEQRVGLGVDLGDRGRVDDDAGQALVNVWSDVWQCFGVRHGAPLDLAPNWASKCAGSG